MISQQELAGSWSQLKGQVREKWGQVTDDELSQAQGNVEQVFGLIQRKTGTARREIEEFFDKAVKDSAGVMGRVASAAQSYAQDASRAVSEGYDQVSHQVQQSVEQAEEVIQNRPAESLCAAFGAGMVVGILMMLFTRTR